MRRLVHALLLATFSSMGNAAPVHMSPSVASRVARLRPDVAADRSRLREKDIRRNVFVAYRGLHGITLAEFDPRWPAKRGEGTFVTATIKDTGPESSWAHSFLTDHWTVKHPGPGELYRGFMLRMEIPGHMLQASGVESDETLGAQILDRGVVAPVSPEHMPDLTPFISHIGIANADKKVTMYPHARIFRSDGKPTAFALKLDAQMTAAP